MVFSHRKNSSKQIIILFLIILFIVIFLFSKQEKYIETNSNYFVWSACNADDTTSVLCTNTIYFHRNSDFKIEPYANCQKPSYDNLQYPYQYGNTFYYTTTNLKTGEDCILAIPDDKPQDNSTDTGEILLSQHGTISYKRATKNTIYYLLHLQNGTAQIHAFHKSTKQDTQVVKAVNPDSSFDVREDGAILFVNVDSEIILIQNGIEQNFGTGTTACFWNEDQIITVTEDGVFTITLSNQKKQKISKKTGYEIVLDPYGDNIALCAKLEYPFGPGFYYTAIYVMDLKNKYTLEIPCVPETCYGIAWFSTEYP